ncbi:CopG family antitoxin [Jiella sonneratiae]|uniref:CopG family antitoxin n=1 Tax=Jiella sonneratiae TaxID=2816856 RepID=UPI00315ADB91
MTNAKPPRPIFDSEEERADFEFHDSDEWVSVDNVAAEHAALRASAQQILAGKRPRRISISISERDLARLKIKAAEKGMPYQTLINSILHDYVEG